MCNLNGTECEIRVSSPAAKPSSLWKLSTVHSWTREQQRRSPVRATRSAGFEAGSRGHMVKRAEAAQAADQQEVNKPGLAHTRAPMLVFFHSRVIAD